jgi:hypothetical protein
MARLRELRLAKEAAEAAQPQPVKTKSSGKASGKTRKAAARPAATLSDYLKAEKSSGRMT